MPDFSDLPTPIEILIDPLSLMVLALYGGLLLWETARPGRALPAVRGWRTRTLVTFGVYFYLSSYLPLLWDGILAQHQLLDLTALGTAGGALVGLLAYTLASYGWHRAMHRSKVLWRVFHQMHHSAERLDAWGAFYFSPLDMVGWTAIGSLVMVGAFGVTTGAATAFLLGSTFLGMFQHTNVKTPRWLGYVIQRPESHTIHHGKGIHAWNYSDLPIWDLLFGTFRNPEDFPCETGLHHGASARVWDMLRFRDVSQAGLDGSDPEPASRRLAA